MEGRSTVENRRLRNSYHRVCYVFVEQAASECHWNWTAMGDGQCPTEGDSRLRGTRDRSNERLMYEPRDLEHNALTDWQPVQLP